MKCFFHEDRDAVATCQRCGKSLCKECASKYKIVYCEDCAREMVVETENEKERKKQEKLANTKGEIIGSLIKGKGKTHQSYGKRPP